MNGLLFLPGTGLLASGGWDGRVVLWDREGRLVSERQTGSPVTAMALERENGIFWTGHRDGSLRRWGSGLELLERDRLPGGRRVTAIASTPGRLAVAGRGGGLWIRAPGKEGFRRIARLSSYLRTLVFDEGGGRLFGGSWFRLYRWDLDDGGMAVLDTDHFGVVTALDWDPSRSLLFSISRQTDSSILALDPETGATRTDFGRHELCGADVAVSRNGRLLVTTSDDGSVRIWRLPLLLP